MHKMIQAFWSTKVPQTALLTIVALAAAGCSSDVGRFGETPVYTGSTPNQQSIIGGGQPLQSYPSDSTGSIDGPVQRTMVPPPPGPVQPYAPPMAAQPSTEPNRLTAATVYQPMSRLSPNYTTVGAGTVTVAQGETIDMLSRRYGVPLNEIRAANGISDGAEVAPGARLVIPVFSAVPAAAAVPAAPRAQASAVRPSPAPAVAVTGAAVGPHVVKPGETIERIAASYGVTRKSLMQANGLTSEFIRSGQRLTLPSGAVLRVARDDSPAAAAVTTPAPTQPVASAKPVVAEAPKPAEIKTASLPPSVEPRPAESVALAKEPPIDSESSRGEAKNGTPSFRWPVRGRVIKEFGTVNGERNDGINLAVPEGTSVKAAEDGEVIYSGNELKGYGNLVLVRHVDGWVTAYAHASELLVNRGDKVTRGQIIARAGATGGVAQPQLHFEIRKGQRPVDPKQFLASN